MPSEYVHYKNCSLYEVHFKNRKILERYYHLFAIKIIHYKAVHYRRVLLYAFPVFKQTTASVTVPSRENVRRTVATAATTPCCTVLNAYFPAKCGVRSQLVLTLVSM